MPLSVATHVTYRYYNIFSAHEDIVLQNAARRGCRCGYISAASPTSRAGAQKKEKIIYENAKFQDKATAVSKFEILESN
jgi:hypothetical protein